MIIKGEGKEEGKGEVGRGEEEKGEGGGGRDAEEKLMVLEKENKNTNE